jgi:hypothetical protein
MLPKKFLTIFKARHDSVTSRKVRRGRVTELVSEKVTQNVAQPIFAETNTSQFYHVKNSPKIWPTFVIFRRTARSKQLPNCRKFAQFGHPGRARQLCTFLVDTIIASKFKKIVFVLLCKDHDLRCLTAEKKIDLIACKTIDLSYCTFMQGDQIGRIG